MPAFIKRTSSAASAPHGVLTRIFYMTYSRTKFNCAADASLARFALVNKQWLQAARDVLYSHVYLGSSEVGEVIELFLRTLSKSPGLTRLIRAIDFGTFYMDERETSGLAAVIKLCDNLCEVRLNGWNSHELKDLIHALKSKRLQVLDISHNSLSDRDCGYFCYLPEFIEMLQGWPELRSVTVWMDTVGFDHSGLSFEADEEKAPRSIEVISGACPELRRFDWRSGCLEERHLAAISKLAPSLSEFQLKEGRMMTRQDLLAPLQLWAPRLTHFILNFYEAAYSCSVPGNDAKPSVDRDLDDMILAMPLLRILDISSMYLKPATLSHGFTALTILDYRITAQELNEFISILSDPTALPSLCELSISPRISKENFDSALLDNKHALCRSRGITIRDQFYREMLDLGIVYDFGDF